MQPTTIRLAAAAMGAASSGGPPSKAVPMMIVAGAVGTVVAYVGSQLHNESQTMDRMFAKKNGPQVEEARKTIFGVESGRDVRRTPYNVLNW